jgi:gluconolactonase
MKPSFFNDRWGSTIRIFDIATVGGLSGGAVWATISGEDDGVPNGMKIDLDGRIVCNAPGGVHVLSPSGWYLGKIATPQKFTNVCFSGPEGKTLFVTTCTSVYAIETLTRAKSMIPQNKRHDGSANHRPA